LNINKNTSLKNSPAKMNGEKKSKQRPGNQTNQLRLLIFCNGSKKLQIELIASFKVSQNVWQVIQKRFEIDYNAKATATSIVAIPRG
jgi:hypothetical protein